MTGTRWLSLITRPYYAIEQHLQSREGPMIERLGTRAQSLTPANWVSLLAFATGLLLALAYSLVPSYWSRPPVIPLAYVILGLVTIVLHYQRLPAELLAFMLLGAVNTFSLILLPAVLVASVGWWLALIVVSLLSLLIGAPVLGSRAVSFAGLHLIGALGGGWAILTAADTFSFQSDTVLLGIGVLLLGDAIIILFSPPRR